MRCGRAPDVGRARLAVAACYWAKWRSAGWGRGRAGATLQLSGRGGRLWCCESDRGFRGLEEAKFACACACKGKVGQDFGWTGCNCNVDDWLPNGKSLPSPRTGAGRFSQAVDAIFHKAEIPCAVCTLLHSWVHGICRGALAATQADTRVLERCPTSQGLIASNGAWERIRSTHFS